MVSNEKCSTSTNWSIPRPLRDNKSTLPCFPVNCLPIIPKAMAIGISQSTSTDISMSVTALLAALSHCFSGVYRMEGKPDHSEPITLYSLILAEPAERKSPIMRFVKAPFISFAKEYNDSHKAQVYASQEEKLFSKLKLKSFKRSAKHLLKKSPKSVQILMKYNQLIFSVCALMMLHQKHL